FCHITKVITLKKATNSYPQEIAGEPGLTFNQTLDSSYGLIEILLQEYSFVMRQRNKMTDEDGNVEGRDYEWVELPSFDDPSKTVRIKKYNDIAGKVKR
ncbi:hypothetical protein ABHZ97_25105, partial [Bacteroides ovatus]